MSLHLQSIPYPALRAKDPLDVKQQSQQIRNSRLNAESMYNLRNAQTQDVLNRTNSGYYNDVGMPPLARLWHRITILDQNPNLPNNPSMQRELGGYKQLYNNLLSQQQALTARNMALATTQPYRALSPEAKLALDQEMASQGYYPTAATGLLGQKIGTQYKPEENVITVGGQNYSKASPTEAIEEKQLPLSEKQISQIQKNVQQLGDLENIPITNEEKFNEISQLPKGMSQKELVTTLQNAITKKSVPTATLNRLYYASAIEKILPTLVDKAYAMEYYTGPEGRARLAYDKSKALTGVKPNKELLDYNIYTSAASQLAHQLTNFWKTTITPYGNQQLNAMMNPSGFFKSPKEAKVSLQTVLSLFHNELSGLLEPTRETPLIAMQPKEFIIKDRPKMRNYGEEEEEEGELPEGLSENMIKHYMDQFGWDRDEIIRRYEAKYAE